MAVPPAILAIAMATVGSKAAGMRVYWNRPYEQYRNER